MIIGYKIHNFKSHKDTEIQMAPLTILTGVNGTGKSSIFQSMLILRETYLKRASFSKLFLSGESFKVGSAFDLVNANVPEDKDLLRFHIRTDNEASSFSFRYIAGESTTLSLIGDDGQTRVPTTSLFTDDFQYLSAFRYGPQLTYDSDTDVVDDHRQLSQRMGMGEFTIYYLAKYGTLPIPISELKYKNSESSLLQDQVQYWMGEISEGLQMKIDQTGKQYLVSFGYRQDGKQTKYFTPINTGYGISYILSVVVAILSAKQGSLLLIENPEAHIHPSGQAALMRMMSIAAANGVQIVIESHSDHIVNGAMVAIHEKTLLPTEVSLNYFLRSSVDNTTEVVRLPISDTGRIKKAPKGFFDQIDIDLKTIMGF